MRNRSTTSSTTAKTINPPPKKTSSTETVETVPNTIPFTNSPNQEPHSHINHDSPPLLTPDQQQIFLALVARGASPAAACQKLGITVSEISQALADNPQFQLAYDEVHNTLNQNVVAALYRSAMEGRVTAQTFWLKNRPPPEWPNDHQQPTDNSQFKDLTDDELIELATTAGVNLPPEITTAAHSESSKKIAKRFSTRTQTDIE